MPKKEQKSRQDTFWKNTDTANAEYFQKIVDGTHHAYELREEEDINLDYKRRRRACWRVYSKKTGKPADSLRSTNTYRLAAVWAALTVGEDGYFAESRRLRLLADLPTIRTKRGDHTRHRCPNGWCCRPCHLQIGYRTTNEVDKHFHYFLRECGPIVAKRFMDEFASLCKEQRVWGFYPPE